MGHTRLGPIPKSRKWEAIVASLSEASGRSKLGEGLLADEIASISGESLDAASAGVQKAIDDAGLCHAFFLLTQLVLAAREDDWNSGLSKIGIDLPANPTVFDLTSSIQTAIDEYLFERSSVTDISEMAQKAVGESLMAMAGPQTGSLFDDDGEVLRSAIQKLSTKNGFADLGQTFFGHFMARFLNFYLSRVTATHVGSNKLPQIAEVTRFNEALNLHCYQSARVVHDFCGEWYSKTEWKQGINPENTSRFIAVAMKKFERELQDQKVANG